ncbi:MAG TPA: hypothetical protein VLB09_06235 [Nitrospiria bacterium]|nr:hypothetical protein [Nitrospiria bacterium]
MLGLKIPEIPVDAWMSSRCDSDLAGYYKRVFSYGEAYEIGEF